MQDRNKIWKLGTKPCNPAFYLLCTFDFFVTVSVKIEHPIVLQVIILHIEQSNTTTHVHFVIATCYNLTLGCRSAMFKNTGNLDLNSVRQFYVSFFIFVYNLCTLMMTCCWVGTHCNNQIYTNSGGDCSLCNVVMVNGSGV